MEFLLYLLQFLKYKLEKKINQNFWQSVQKLAPWKSDLH